MSENQFDFEPSVVTNDNVCSWPVKYTQCSVDGLAGMSAEDKAAVEEMAVDLLWNMTGGKFGLCPTIVRPCTSGCESGKQWTDTFWGRGPFPWLGQVAASMWLPVNIGGGWYNVTCGCVGNCNCSLFGPETIMLPGPVDSITTVTIDGEILSNTSYRLQNRALIRTDGEAWPTCQNLFADSTEPGTFEIEYLRGNVVPLGGQYAAGTLAIELAKSMCGDNTCELPQRVQTITRQGVTMAMLDGFENLNEGRVGIWSIDAWIASVTMAKPFASVRSVDIPSPAARYGN